MKRIYSDSDLDYAFEQAIDFLECEEWPQNDGGAQVEAYREAAKQIRKILEKRIKKQIKVAATIIAKRKGNP